LGFITSVPIVYNQNMETLPGPQRVAEVLVQVACESLRAALEAHLRADGVGVSQSSPAEPTTTLAAIVDAPDGAEGIAQIVRGYSATWRNPPGIVLVAAAAPAYSVAQALVAGVDELIVWPDQKEELTARVIALVRRRAHDTDIHPMTGLPGGAGLHRRLEAAFPQRGRLAVLALDLRNFKAFNDRYGFARGDRVLAFVADLVEDLACGADTAYHLGGDDFFLVTSPERADALAQQAVDRFDAAIQEHYDEQDWRNGYITGLSRLDGAQIQFPIMTLTVACGTNEADDITHVGQMVQVLAELKEYAKRQPSSTWVRDRRQVHDVAISLRLRKQRQAP